MKIRVVVFLKFFLVSLFISAQVFATQKTPEITPAATAEKVIANKTSITDPFFEDFVKKANNSYVVLGKNGRQIYFFSNPSLLRDAVSLAVAGCLGWCAWGFGSATYYFYKKGETEAFIAGIITVAFAALALYIAKDLPQNTIARFKDYPYLIIDSRGIRVYENWVLEWKNVDGIHTKTVSNLWGDSVIVSSNLLIVALELLVLLCNVVTKVGKYTITEAKYIDETRNMLFSLSGDDDCIPLCYEEMKRLVDHCLATYGKDKFKINEPVNVKD